MRVIRQWLFRERDVRGPSAIELDVVERQVTREEAGVCSATGEAATIEQRLQCVRNSVREALTDVATPGVIDATESRQIARQLVGVSVQAHHHTQTLEALT